MSGGCRKDCRSWRQAIIGLSFDPSGGVATEIGGDKRQPGATRR
jgi:hypothetical protein